MPWASLAPPGGTLQASQNSHHLSLLQSAALTCHGYKLQLTWKQHPYYSSPCSPIHPPSRLRAIFLKFQFKHDTPLLKNFSGSPVLSGTSTNFLPRPFKIWPLSTSHCTINLPHCPQMQLPDLAVSGTPVISLGIPLPNSSLPRPNQGSLSPGSPCGFTRLRARTFSF